MPLMVLEITIFPKQLAPSWTTSNQHYGDISSTIKMNTQCQLEIEGRIADDPIQNMPSTFVLRFWLTLSHQKIMSMYSAFVYGLQSWLCDIYRNTMHDVQMGQIDISESEWPSFLYPQGTSWDLDDDKTDLFRGYLLLAVSQSYYNICAKNLRLLYYSLGFLANLHWPKDSNGSRGGKEGSCEQVSPPQFDGSDSSHDSLHLCHCKFKLTF